jgi:thiazole synthase ThiGH ThiG subunit
METHLDKLKIGEKVFNSRLLLGTGKYRTTKDAIGLVLKIATCEIVTVAIRRLPTRFKK